MKKRIPEKSQIWIDARKRFHLSDAQIQMARELGMNPKKFGKLANHKQEPWKAPLPEFIEHLYLKRFGKPRPDRVISVEDSLREIEKKKKEKRERKESKREMIVGVAWYRPEQWERLREISSDRENIEETYAEWLQNALRGFEKLKASGLDLERVEVDAEELLKWCETEKIPVDGDARVEFVANKLREKDKRNR